MDGLAAARARGRTGGQKPKLGPRQVRLARQMYDERGADGKRRYTVAQIAAEFGVARPTIYRHLSASPRRRLRTGRDSFCRSLRSVGWRPLRRGGRLASEVNTPPLPSAPSELSALARERVVAGLSRGFRVAPLYGVASHDRSLSAWQSLLRDRLLDRRCGDESGPATREMRSGSGGAQSGRRLLGRGVETAQFDQAARFVGVVWHEARELGLGRQRVEEPLGDAFVQRADRRLVFIHGVGVRAVAQAERDPVALAELGRGLEPSAVREVSNASGSAAAPSGASSRPIWRPVCSMLRSPLVRDRSARASHRPRSW